MVQKVFVFDMDGVLVPSEKEWIKTEGAEGLLEKMVGLNIAQGIGDTIGMSVGEIYKKGVALGATITKGEFQRLYDQAATQVYKRCQITAGVDQLVIHLKAHDWKLALVSSSPMTWINQVLPRLTWKDHLDLVLSVNEHPEIKPKPAPDGYQYILKTLGAKAKDSLALEDSNPGIASAKAAGLFTIGYTQHLVEGYRQIAADATARNMDEVKEILIGQLGK